MLFPALQYFTLFEMVTWSFFGLLLIHSWKWFLQISLSIGHIVPFKMTLLTGTKMILRQKGRWFLTTNSQFAILTELSAHEQYGLCLIMPKVFWFLKLHVLTLDTAKPELLIFFFWNALLSHYVVVYMIISSIFLVRRGRPYLYLIPYFISC